MTPAQRLQAQQGALAAAHQRISAAEQRRIGGAVANTVALREQLDRVQQSKAKFAAKKPATVEVGHPEIHDEHEKPGAA